MPRETGGYIPEKERYREIETSNARYRILYGMHIFEQDATAVSDVDGVMLEGVGKLETIKEVVADPDTEIMPQMKAVMKYCNANQKPYYFVDIPVKNFSVLGAVFDRLGGSTLEAGIAVLLAKLYKDEIGKKGRISRREALRKLAYGAGALVSGAYSATPAVGDSLSVLSQLVSPNSSDLENAARIMTKFNEKTHPHLYSKLLTLRNLVMAQRAEAVAAQENQKLGRKPFYAVVLGAGHTGIEEALPLQPAERVKRIKDYLPKNADLSDLRQIPKVGFEPSGDGRAGKPSLEFVEDKNF